MVPSESRISASSGKSFFNSWSSCAVPNPSLDGLGCAANRRPDTGHDFLFRSGLHDWGPETALSKGPDNGGWEVSAGERVCTARSLSCGSGIHVQRSHSIRRELRQSHFMELAGNAGRHIPVRRSSFLHRTARSGPAATDAEITAD